MNFFNKDLLVGKRILVTGASSGIGSYTAVALNSLGASVVIQGRDELRLMNVYRRLQGEHNHYYVQDFSDFDSGVNFFTTIQSERGSFDGIFHCAGAALIKPARLMSNLDLKAVIDSSVTSSLALAKVFSRKSALVEGASIIFMSSVAAKNGQVGMVLYSTAKAAVTGLVKSLAVELANNKVRVNSLICGAVDTELHHKLLGRLTSSSIEDYKSSHLLGFGSVEDISNLAIFLMSDASKWITGSEITVDGGYSTR